MEADLNMRLCCLILIAVVELRLLAQRALKFQKCVSIVKKMFGDCVNLQIRGHVPRRDKPLLKQKERPPTFYPLAM